MNQMLKENIQNILGSAGAICSAGLVMTLSNPFDLVRIRMQTSAELVEMGRLHKAYAGIVDCARRVTKQEGLRAFWKGNSANLIRFYASESINFISKQSIQDRLQPQAAATPGTRLLMNVMSGVLGSWLSLSVLYPIEHTRNRLSNVIGAQKLGLLGTMMKTARTQGILSLYTGSSISMAGVAIFRGTYFGLFDTFKASTNSSFERWLLAYFSSVMAILLTYPSDTVRRRLICNEAKGAKYKGFLDCLTKIYQRQGVLSFYRGGPIIFLQSLSSSCVLYLYDKIYRDLKKLYH